MRYLCCIFKRGNTRDFIFNTNEELMYRYYDTESCNYQDLNILTECANIDANGKGRGFSISDIIIDVDFGGQYGFLAVEEYVNKSGKLTHLGVVDMRNYKVCVMPIEKLLEKCKLFDKSSIYNYSLVNGKFLRKKPNAVVELKRTEDFLNNKIYSQDTFNNMDINTFRKLLKYRDMKIGGICVSNYTDCFNETSILIDEFWYKDSSILRLTYNADKNDTLSYYAGELFLVTKKSSGCNDFRASGGKDYYYSYGDVYEYSKDIRENLFKFYDYHKDNLLPTLSYHIGNDINGLESKYMNTFLLSNLVTRLQGNMNSKYMNDTTYSDITYYSLFRLLAFKHNIKHFTSGLKSILKPCIDNLNAILNYECKSLNVNSRIPNEKIREAISWCNQELNKSNECWKNLKD